MNNLSWDEQVFLKRNRSYGAYIIRKEYPSALAASFVFMLVVIAVLVAMSPFVGKLIKVASRDKAVKKLILNIIPPVDKPKAEPKKPTPVTQHPRHVVQRIVEEPVVVDETPVAIEQQVVSTDNTAIDEQNVSFETGAVRTPSTPAINDPNKVWTAVEVSPEFPGGVSGLMKFIGKNTRYPASARRQNVEGSVFISFVVNADGTIEHVEAIKGLQEDCDKEAIRVVSKMPAWKPGKQSGVPVKVKFVLPVKFKLGDS